MFFHAMCRQGGTKGRRRRRGENRLSFLYIHDDIIFFAAAAEDYSAGINFGAKRLSSALSLTSLHGIQGPPEVRKCSGLPPTIEARLGLKIRGASGRHVVRSGPDFERTES